MPEGDKKERLMKIWIFVLAVASGGCIVTINILEFSSEGPGLTTILVLNVVSVALVLVFSLLKIEKIQQLQGYLVGLSGIIPAVVSFLIYGSISNWDTHDEDYLIHLLFMAPSLAFAAGRFGQGDALVDKILFYAMIAPIFIPSIWLIFEIGRVSIFLAPCVGAIACAAASVVIAIMMQLKANRAPPA
ncbi:hypothetical protein GF325_15215 [Candidatus Bathyarchaeota archaeon]|nr:hypothetical protein [Candidatus Bathyarchaeota archaeon]